jgi:hypothetical protein
MILTITVTKEILEASKNCGEEKPASISESCAIAFAVRDIFPEATVTLKNIYPFLFSSSEILLPPVACEFIKTFDMSTPEERPLLPELSFDIEIPEDVIEQIDISEISKLLEGHPTLKLQTV